MITEYWILSPLNTKAGPFKKGNPAFCLRLLHQIHAGWHPEGGGDGSKNSDCNVENLAPEVLVFHFLKGYRWKVKGDGWKVKG